MHRLREFYWGSVFQQCTLIGIFVCISRVCFAQETLRHDYYLATKDSLRLPDSLNFYFPESFCYSKDRSVSFGYEKLKIAGSTIFFGPELIKQYDSLWLSLRVFPIVFNKYKFILDSSLHQNAAIPDYALEGYRPKKNTDWWDSKGIEYSGNYTRGLSLGSNQSLILNSALNLQLSGDLGDGITLTGAISDNQIPIQPDGNTRQIQEFDRLFLKLSKGKNSLTAGDFELARPIGYFQNYYKKSQGGLIDYYHNLGQWKLNHKLSLGISRGKFNRQNIVIVNGNQGPYRLKGRDGESFIILLAGTEKVFIDGIQLTRGEDADYVMDYNLAEIRFTPKRLVTDQMRVFVEFEYADQYYLRTINTYNAQASKGKWFTYLNFYQEKDSKRPAVSSDQDSTDRVILFASGDQSELAVRSSISKSGSQFNPNRVYYSLKDTSVLIQGQLRLFSILEYNDMPDSNSLQASFAEIGPGKGAYQLKRSNANGRVYEWVGYHPLTGVLLGSYTPAIPLIAPRSHSMLMTGVHYNSLEKDKAGFNLETGISLLDKNRISSKDDGDNIGFASRVDLRSQKYSKKWFGIQMMGNHEFNDYRFVALNPYRNQEFSRDWNIQSQTGSRDQIYTARANMIFGKHLNSFAEYKAFDRSIGFKGSKQEVGIQWNDGLQSFQLKLDFLQTKAELEKTNYNRPGFKFSRQFGKKISVQTYFEQEVNSRRSTQQDSLFLSSFYFNVYGANFKYESSSAWIQKLDFRRRTDQISEGKNFQKFSISDELTFSSSIPKSKTGQWDGQLSVRNISYSNPTLNDSLGQYYFLGQMDHSLSLQKNSIRIKNVYSIQSGAEPRVEFIFEERRPGDGDYIFMDFNGDGIRQIQEYVFAPEVDTARFVRIQLFNSEYIQTFQSLLNQVVQVDFNRLLPSLHPKNFLRKLYFESILRFNSKLSPETEWYQQINPFVLNQLGEKSLAFQKFSQQHLYINRANPRYEIQHSILSSSNRQLLTSGVDERTILDFQSKSRLTTFSKMDWIFTYNFRNEKKFTESYALQNYLIESSKFEGNLVYRIHQNHRINGSFLYRNFKELETSFEKAGIKQFQIGGQSTIRKKISLRSEVKWIIIDYRGNSGTAVEYIMLDGFKDGNNLSMEYYLDIKFSDVITAQFSYFVRKSAESTPIQTGRASIRANF